MINNISDLTGTEKVYFEWINDLLTQLNQEEVNNVLELINKLWSNKNA